MYINAETGKPYVEKLTKEERKLLRNYCIGFNHWDKFIAKIRYIYGNTKFSKEGRRIPELVKISTAENYCSAVAGNTIKILTESGNN